MLPINEGKVDTRMRVVPRNKRKPEERTGLKWWWEKVLEKPEGGRANGDSSPMDGEGILGLFFQR